MSGHRTPQPDQAAEQRLAGIHLHAGVLWLARAELEALAARGAIAGVAYADLAEARWRTGDLERAAEAAAAHLAADGELPIAHLILAEAEAAAGRPDGAKAHQAALASLSMDELARLFAGMPHRANWPSLTAGGLQANGLTAETGTPPPADPSSVPVVERRARGRNARRQPPPAFPSGVDLVAQARDDMRSGEPERMANAFDRLALAVRMDPATAPRVVDLVTRRQEPAALLVRGDAFRILGRVLEAEAAYAAAAAELDRQSRHRT